MHVPARVVRLAAGAALALLFCTPAAAHRLDELLQTSRVAVERGRLVVEVDLSPGVEVVPQFLKAVGADRQGSIPSTAGHDYAQRLVAQMALTLDGRSIRPRLSESEYPTVSLLKEGVGIVHIRAVATLPQPMGVGRHILVYRNGSDAPKSLYMANALVPNDPTIAILTQERDPAQRQLSIEFDVRQGSRAAGWVLAIAATVMLGLILGVVVKAYRWNL